LSECVVCYRSSGVNYYKSMGVSTVTQDVKNELDAHKNDEYVSVTMGTLEIYNDGEGNPHEPDEDGYYTQSQVFYEVDTPESSVFIKRINTDPITFWDYVSDEEITIP